jgi:hypothetical protein
MSFLMESVLANETSGDCSVMVLESQAIVQVSNSPMSVNVRNDLQYQELDLSCGVADACADLALA